MLACVPAAGAAPPLERDPRPPVLLIHGYQHDEKDHCSRWNKDGVKNALKRVASDVVTVGYYMGDGVKNCDLDLNGWYSRNASLRDLGRALALRIYRDYSKKGKPVDIVAHSMGGLIARTAITGMREGWPGYPPHLYVQDVVTLGTPHRGVDAAKWVHKCPYRQCVQMRPGSDFLTKKLARENPQASSGTDWTLIGSAADHTVRARSATKTPNHDGGMAAGHYVGFTSGADISHGDLRKAITIAPSLLDTTLWRNARAGGPWQTSSQGTPITAARDAIEFPNK